VVLAEGRSSGPDELIAFVAGKIARFKCPKSVEFVASLPRNAAGKVMRRTLREPYWQGVARVN
jgi:acyl-CoA synthetase (AMP-forming)/AMP-acid ligase II